MNTCTLLSPKVSWQVMWIKNYQERDNDHVKGNWASKHMSTKQVIGSLIGVNV